MGERSFPLTTEVLGGDRSLAAIKAHARLPRNAVVLDIGCNTGLLSLALADSLGCQVWGLDKSSDAISIALKRAQDVTHGGTVQFVIGDILDPEVSIPHRFDLIVHRGLEPFISNPKDFRQTLFERCKEWGYLANITQTYEGKFDEDLIRRLNAASGVNIVPESRLTITEHYKKSGFVEVASTEIPIDVSSSLIHAQLDQEQNLKEEVITLSEENDRQTSGFVLLFRRPMNVALSTYSAKG